MAQFSKKDKELGLEKWQKYWVSNDSTFWYPILNPGRPCSLPPHCDQTTEENDKRIDCAFRGWWEKHFQQYTEMLQSIEAPWKYHEGALHLVFGAADTDQEKFPLWTGKKRTDQRLCLFSSQIAKDTDIYSSRRSFGVDCLFPLSHCDFAPNASGDVWRGKLSTTREIVFRLVNILNQWHACEKPVVITMYDPSVTDSYLFAFAAQYAMGVQFVLVDRKTGQKCYWRQKISIDHYHCWITQPQSRVTHINKHSRNASLHFRFRDLFPLWYRDKQQTDKNYIWLNTLESWKNFVNSIKDVKLTFQWFGPDWAWRQAKAIERMESFRNLSTYSYGIKRNVKNLRDALIGCTVWLEDIERRPMDSYSTLYIHVRSRSDGTTRENTWITPLDQMCQDPQVLRYVFFPTLSSFSSQPHQFPYPEVTEQNVQSNSLCISGPFIQVYHPYADYGDTTNVKTLYQKFFERVANVFCKWAQSGRLVVFHQDVERRDAESFLIPALRKLVRDQQGAGNVNFVWTYTGNELSNARRCCLWNAARDDVTRNSFWSTLRECNATKENRYELESRWKLNEVLEEGFYHDSVEMLSEVSVLQGLKQILSKQKNKASSWGGARGAMTPLYTLPRIYQETPQKIPDFWSRRLENLKDWPLSRHPDGRRISKQDYENLLHKHSKQKQALSDVEIKRVQGYLRCHVYRWFLANMHKYESWITLLETLTTEMQSKKDWDILSLRWGQNAVSDWTQDAKTEYGQQVCHVYMDQTQTTQSRAQIKLDSIDDNDSDDDIQHDGVEEDDDITWENEDDDSDDEDYPTDDHSVTSDMNAQIASLLNDRFQYEICLPCGMYDPVGPPEWYDRETRLVIQEWIKVLQPWMTHHRHVSVSTCTGSESVLVPSWVAEFGGTYTIFFQTDDKDPHQCWSWNLHNKRVEHKDTSERVGELCRDWDYTLRWEKDWHNQEKTTMQSDVEFWLSLEMTDDQKHACETEWPEITEKFNHREWTRQRALDQKRRDREDVVNFLTLNEHKQVRNALHYFTHFIQHLEEQTEKNLQSHSMLVIHSAQRDYWLAMDDWWSTQTNLLTYSFFSGVTGRHLDRENHTFLNCPFPAVYQWKSCAWLNLWMEKFAELVTCWLEQDKPVVLFLEGYGDSILLPYLKHQITDARFLAIEDVWMEGRNDPILRVWKWPMTRFQYGRALILEHTQLNFPQIPTNIQSDDGREVWKIEDLSHNLALFARREDGLSVVTSENVKEYMQHASSHLDSNDTFALQVIDEQDLIVSVITTEDLLEKCRCVP